MFPRLLKIRRHDFYFWRPHNVFQTSLEMSWRGREEVLVSGGMQFVCFYCLLNIKSTTWRVASICCNIMYVWNSKLLQLDRIFCHSRTIRFSFKTLRVLSFVSPYLPAFSIYFGEMISWNLLRMVRGHYWKVLWEIVFPNLPTSLRENSK